MPDSCCSGDNPYPLPLEPACGESVYRRALTLSSEVLYQCIRRGAVPFHLVWLEGAITGVTGFSREELLAKECFCEIVHPEDAAIVALQKHLSPGDAGETVYRLVRKNGSVCRVSESYRCEAGDVPGETLLYGALRIISNPGSDAVEAKVTAYAGGLQGEILVKRINAALVELSNALWIEQDLESYCRKVHAIFESALGVTNFFIGLADEQANMVRFPYFADVMDGPRFAIPDMAPPSKATPTLHVLRTGKPALFSKNCRMKRVESGEFRTTIGTLSEVWLGVPLIIQGKVIGVIGVQDYTDPNFFSNKDVSLLTSAAELISVAIQRNQAALALKESEQRFRKIFDSVSDAIFVHDVESGRILDVNQRACELYGYTSEEMVRLDVGTLSSGMPPYTQLDAEEKVRQASLGVVPPFEWQAKTRDGKLFWILVSMSTVDYSDEKRVLVSVQDITSRKRVEEALVRRVTALTKPVGDAEGITFEGLFNQEEIQRLQDEFASATGVASIITNPGGAPITSPSNFCRLCKDIIRGTSRGLSNCCKSDAMLGKYSPSGPQIQLCMSGGLYDAGAGISAGGKHIANWLIGQVRDESMTEDRIRCYAKEIGADEGLMAEAFQEVPVMSRGHFEEVAKALFTLANQLSSIAYQNMQQGRFIAERQRAEVELMHAKELADAASRAKSEFLANMSHEIRTPLNGVMGMLQLLETTEQTEEQKEYVHTAIRSSKRLTSLLSDILDLSRIEAGKMIVQDVWFEVRNLKGAVLDLFGVAAKDKGLGLRFDFDERLPMDLMGDESRVRQIIFNLVGNSIKFTRTGGISVEVVALPNMMDDVYRVLFVVRDTGDGIPDEMLNRIFEPFVQGEGSYVRRFQGAGLGLSIVGRMVDLLGGGLCIESELGTGTAVYLSLPFKKYFVSKSMAASILAHSRLPDDSGLRILFAEDDAVTRLSVKKLLEKSGYQVALAVDGADALVKLEREPFDLILMDIQMPELDGVEATRAIRFQDRFESVRDIPIIAVTAYAMSGDRDKFLGAGMSDYISKPVDIEALRAVIARVMGKRRLRLA